MKVGSNNNLDILASKQAAAVQPKAAPSAADAARATTRAASAGVPVTVSSSARTLEGTGRASADIDMAKVNAMRAAIAAGTFRINASVIADRLLTESAHNLAAAVRR